MGKRKDREGDPPQDEKANGGEGSQDPESSDAYSDADEDEDSSESAPEVSDDEDEEDDDSGGADGEAFDEVNVNFQFFDPQEKDFHGLKALLHTYLDGQQYDSSGLVDTIIKQVRRLQCHADPALMGAASTHVLWSAQPPFHRYAA